MKIGKLIDIYGGELVQGDPETELSGISATGSATSIDLVFAEDAKTASEALSSACGALVVKPGLVDRGSTSKAVIETQQPRLWFAQAAWILTLRGRPFQGVHPTATVASTSVLPIHATVGPGAAIGENCVFGASVWIDAGAVIGDECVFGDGVLIGSGAVLGLGVHVGTDSRIHPRVVVYAGTILGKNVTVHAGAVLGADGFGYVRDNATGAYTQFPQQGTLVIEDDVEIGANSTIDRGALRETRIRRGAKIDNLVHVGHNCDIGEDVILVALTGISGSCTVGKGAVIAGQVGIGDHAHIGPGVILGGQAGVLSGKTVTNEGLKPGTVLWGTPARPLKQVLREQAVLVRLARRQSKPAN
jgi:UDP-3-O-[3-hydroxymyristoyl] glucosamine N-acyltransferase